MTIEERAEQKAWEFEPTDMLQYNVYVDAYVDGATDQQKIDVEKACKMLSLIENFLEVGVACGLKDGTYFGVRFMEDKFRKAMEE